MSSELPWVELACSRKSDLSALAGVASLVWRASSWHQTGTISSHGQGGRPMGITLGVTGHISIRIRAPSTKVVLVQGSHERNLGPIISLAILLCSSFCRYFRYYLVMRNQRLSSRDRTPASTRRLVVLEDLKAPRLSLIPVLRTGSSNETTLWWPVP